MRDVGQPLEEVQQGAVECLAGGRISRAWWVVRPLARLTHPACRDNLRPELFVAAALTSAHSRRKRQQDDRLQERFDVGPAGVMGPDLRALGRVERPLEKRAENRRLDARPVVSLTSTSVLISPSAGRSLRRRRTGRR